MLVFSSGSITGADYGGVLFDGQYQLHDDGVIRGKIVVTAPPNGVLIQGVSTGDKGLKYEVTLELPRDFQQQEYVSLKTPLGVVNVRLVKLRDIQ